MIPELPYGYLTSTGYKGLVKILDDYRWMDFSTEQEYLEFIKEDIDNGRSE